MELLDGLLILAAGLALGWINNLAGGAGVLGLLAMEELAGLGPRAANASIRLSPILLGLGGFASFAQRGHRPPRIAWVYGLMTIPGAMVGAWLALELPVIVYQIYLGVVLFALLIKMLHSRRQASRRPKNEAPPELLAPRPWKACLLFTLLGLHMGFVQVATGLVAIMVLSAVYSRDLIAINSVKMVLVLIAAIGGCAVFAAGGTIAWGPATVLAVGAGIGSYAGAKFSVKRGHDKVALVVIAVTAIMLVRIVVQSF